MKQHVSIARALKEKSRIAGRIHTLTDVINHENSLAEGVKSIIGFLNRLNTSEAFSDDYSRHVKLKAAIRKADVLIEVDAYQRRANAIQDELDDFNASHFVDIELTA